MAEKLCSLKKNGSSGGATIVDKLGFANASGAYNKSFDLSSYNTDIAYLYFASTYWKALYECNLATGVATTSWYDTGYSAYANRVAVTCNASTKVITVSQPGANHVGSGGMIVFF